MWYVFIAMPLLALIKTTVQGRYSKKNVETFSDVLFYNSAVFLTATITLAVIFLRQMPPLEVIIYALLNGAFSVLFQSFYTLAFRNGPVSATVIINSFNLVLILLAGTIFFNETWSIFAIIGFVFMALAFYLLPARGGDKKANLKWFIFVLLTFFFGGLTGVVTLFFSRSEFNAMQPEFVVFTFLIAFVLCSIITLFNVKVKKDPITIKKDWKLPTAALVIGASVGLYNLVTVIALQNYDSYIVSPVVNGTLMVLIMITNCILDKEKPTKKMIFGLISAVIGIVLLNL